MNAAKTILAVFAILFVAAVFIGCSTKTTPAVTGTTNTPTGDVAGLDKAFDLEPTQADPTSDLPTGADVTNAAN